MSDCVKDVCAGIVLYEPELGLLKKNIKAIYGQVDKVFLFDNASSNGKQIRKMAEKSKKLVYIRNEKNEGIAKALKKIIDFADESAYKWCLTLDQDSVCSAGMISEYLKNIKRDDIAICCPYILNNGKLSLEELKALGLPKTTLITDPIDCITSGALNNVEFIKKSGNYCEKLFIDFVDIEMNCRILKNGFKILRCNQVYLVQQMGKSKYIPFLHKLYKLTGIDAFRRMQAVPEYGDLRLYYSSRNSRYVRKKYPGMCRRASFPFMLFLFSYYSVFYPLNRNRLTMWKSIINGFFDYKNIGE